MTTLDNRARSACRSRRALNRADLARHVEGDYGSEDVPPVGVTTESFPFCLEALGHHQS
jgi:hypothetical protein